MKKTGLFAVILFGLCAVIWSVKAIYEAVSMLYPTTPFLLAVDVLCAICWIVGFIVQLKRYKMSSKEE